MSRQRRIAVVTPSSTSPSPDTANEGQQVVSALCRRGYHAVPLRADGRLDRRLRQSGAGVVFNALPQGHPLNTNLQGLCELLGVPFTGSDVLASALTKDAVKVKEVLRLHNLPTPSYYTVQPSDLARLVQIHGSFGFPVRVRPGVVTEEDPHGQVASDLHQLHRLCYAAVAGHRGAVVERHVPGARIAVGILQGHALGVRRVDGQRSFIAKGGLGAERRAGLVRLALRAYQALGCGGAVQVEMVVSELLNEYILGVDTCPPLHPRGVVASLARHHGVDFDDLIELIVSDAQLHNEPAAVKLPLTRNLNDVETGTCPAF